MHRNMAQPLRPKPAVVTVGDELVHGERPRNDNERWLLSEFAARGVPANIAMQLRDNDVKIGFWIKELLRTGHFPVFVSGGLGGTHDDQTRAGVAKALDVPLVRHEECYAILEQKYARTPEGFTEERKRMAQLPAGCALLANPIGAPGFTIGGVWAFPGFPTMLKPMAADALDQMFGARPGDEDLTQATCDRVLRTTEAAIASKVEEFAQSLKASCPDASIGIYPSSANYGREVKLRLRAPVQSQDTHQAFNTFVNSLESAILKKEREHMLTH